MSPAVSDRERSESDDGEDTDPWAIRTLDTSMGVISIPDMRRFQNEKTNVIHMGLPGNHDLMLCRRSASDLALTLMASGEAELEDWSLNFCKDCVRRAKKELE